MRILEHMFDIDALEWPPPPDAAPAEEVIDCLVEEDRAGAVNRYVGRSTSQTVW
ncbi:MAG TPA: hypothetical protein VF734_16895 [Pseudonocardiaceae bacterium]